jgi:type II secretory pathway pseudopilin PulG
MTHARRGKTLIELMAVIATVSLLTGLLGQLFVKMMRSEGTARRGVVARLNLDRLARDFRDDVHSGHRAALVDEAEHPAQVLSIVRGDDSVAEYRVRDGFVRRTILREGEPESRDDYHLEGSDHQFDIESGETERISLQHATGAVAETPSGRRRVVLIQAVLGRDFRFIGGNDTDGENVSSGLSPVSAEQEENRP